MQIRSTQVVAKIIGRFVETFLRETSVWGAGIVLAVLAVFMIALCKISRSSTTEEITLRRND